MHILAIDAGNTRVKGRYFAGPRESGFEWAFDRTELAEAVSEAFSGGSTPERPVDAVAWCAGRREDRGALEKLAMVLGGSAAPRFLLAPEEPLPFAVRYTSGKPGGDRLANAMALREHFPGRGAMAVDVGTAANIVLVGPEGDFRGGVILPGATLGAAALHEATHGRLPEVDVYTHEHLPTGLPASTEDALRVGLLQGLAGGLDRLMELLADRAGFAVEEFVLTGGGAHAVRPLLRQEVTHVPGLTLLGLCAYAKWRLANQPAGGSLHRQDAEM